MSFHEFFYVVFEFFVDFDMIFYHFFKFLVLFFVEENLFVVDAEGGGRPAHWLERVLA